MIAVATYNDVQHFPWHLFSEAIDVFPRIFTGPKGEKGPSYATVHDSQWQKIVAGQYRKVIVFAGKKESGSLEIIGVVAEAFRGRMDQVVFILCRHALEEKRQRIKDLCHGLPPENVREFHDYFEQCREVPYMIGVALELL